MKLKNIAGVLRMVPVDPHKPLVEIRPKCHIKVPDDIGKRMLATWGWKEVKEVSKEVEKVTKEIKK